MTTTINQIKNQIQASDPKLAPGDQSFKVAVILLVSAMGPKYADANQVAKFTGYRSDVCRVVLQRLSANGLGWQGNRFLHSGWLNDKTGGIAFWLDVSMAEGLLAKA